MAILHVWPPSSSSATPSCDIQSLEALTLAKLLQQKRDIQVCYGTPNGHTGSTYPLGAVDCALRRDRPALYPRWDECTFWFSITTLASFRSP